MWHTHKIVFEYLFVLGTGSMKPAVWKAKHGRWVSQCAAWPKDNKRIYKNTTAAWISLFYILIYIFLFRHALMPVGQWELDVNGPQAGISPLLRLAPRILGQQHQTHRNTCLSCFSTSANFSFAQIYSTKDNERYISDAPAVTWACHDLLPRTRPLIVTNLLMSMVSRTASLMRIFLQRRPLGMERGWVDIFLIIDS